MVRWGEVGWGGVGWRRVGRGGEGWGRLNGGVISPIVHHANLALKLGYELNF